MYQVIVFGVVVIISGWALGYLLSRAMRGLRTPPPGAIVISLLAVSVPTLLAFALSDHAGRLRLVSQFQVSPSLCWLWAVALPILVAVVGHISGIHSLKEPGPSLPKVAAMKGALGMVPIAIVWGILEEIGWRGYLVPQLTGFMSGWAASVLVGAIWGVWHAPQMFSNEPLKHSFHGRVWLGAILWSGQCVGLGAILGWLQLRSGSFLVPAAAHALVNLLENVSNSALGPESDPKWAGFTGVPAIVTSLLISLGLFWLS